MAQAPGHLGPVAVAGGWWEGSVLWCLQEPAARKTAVPVYLGMQIR